MLSTSDFDMKSIGREKTAVFMTIHDEKKTYHGLLTIFIKQCYETLIDVAQENGGKLNYRTNFILDEFANMPPLKDVDSMVSAARSRKIRFTFIIQNFSQLTSVYTKEVGDTIKGNCGNLVYLMSTELSALEEISKLCGEVKAKEKDKSATRPLVSVTDLQKMKLFETLLIRQRGNPFKTKLEPDFKMNWGKSYELSDYPNRPRNKVELFDVKKFVTDYKEKQMKEAAENGTYPGSNPFGGPNPFGGGMSPFGPNPFAPNPFAQRPSMPSQNTNPFNKSTPIDIDEMMKDIDKKLKELEEEEKREKEKLRNKSHQTEVVEETNNELNHNKVEEAKKDDNLLDNFLFDEEDDIIDAPLNVYNQPKEVTKPHVEEVKHVENISKAEPKKETTKVIKPKEEDDIDFDTLFDDDNDVESNKPKINVDSDSIIVNDNLITDDEFFDDFFSD
jgi:hypothetical protein